jgi:nitrogen permease regulator 2-like protein
MSGEESFLPRILSIFYAVLDVRQGPKIQFQVPEDLIAPVREQSSFSSSFSPPPPRTPGTPIYAEFNDAGIPIHVMSPVSPLDSDNSARPRESPAKKSLSSSPRTLFYFEDISKYVIPASALCGRLVKCTTQHQRIIGFPVELLGTNYDRREFRFNVCFVFDKSADLSCYEPLVRKIGRVLTACEVRAYIKRHNCSLNGPR